MDYNPSDTVTVKALKETMAYLERNDRTEQTLVIRRLLRDAFAEQMGDKQGMAA